MLVYYFVDIWSAVLLLRQEKWKSPKMKNVTSRVAVLAVHFASIYEKWTFASSAATGSRGGSGSTSSWRCRRPRYTLPCQLCHQIKMAERWPEGLRLRIGNMIYCEFLYEKLWKNKNFIWQLCCHVFECEQFFLLIK